MDTRSGLLHAALALFAARGYEAVGVQEIAAAAGVTKPTLYHFFGSKHGLLEALFSERAAELDLAVEQAAAYDGDLPLTPDRIAACYVSFATREPLFYRFEMALFLAPSDAEGHRVALRHYARRRAVIELMFQRAVRQHGNMRGRHQRYALTLVGMINNYIALQLDQQLVI